MNRMLLNSTERVLCNTQNLFLIWRCFWVTFKSDLNKTNTLVFSDNLSPYQGICSLDEFSLTHCLGMLIHLINFLRQSVTILRELLHLKRFSQTSWRTLLIENLKKHTRFSRWRTKMTARAVVFLWLLLPLTAFPYMVILCWVSLATNFWPLFLLQCCSQVATILSFPSN